MLTEHDHVIQTLPTDGADEPFRVGRLPRAAHCDQHFLDAHVADATLNFLAVDAASVPDQEPRRLLVSERLDGLLCCPLAVRMGPYVEVDHATSIGADALVVSGKIRFGAAATPTSFIQVSHKTLPRVSN